MKESDIFLMLPGKVGPARKLTVLLSRLHGELKEQNQKHSKSSNCGQVETAQESMAEHESSLTECAESEQAMTENETQEISMSGGTQTAQPASNNMTESPSASSITGCKVESLHPAYSKTIQSLLDNGRIMEEWFKFIEETAYHVLSVGGFDQRGLYNDFGRYMCSKYPCLSFTTGKTPWYYFNHVLSQKVRNIRWARKRRSDRISSEMGGKKKKTHLSLAKIDEVKEMDMEEAKKTLELELQKPKEQQDKALIMKAQRATFKERRHFVENVEEDGNIQVILKAHPLLKIEDYVVKEFLLISSKWTSKGALIDQFTEFLNSLDKLYATDVSETEDDPHDPVDTNEAILDLLMTTDHEIKYTPKKSKKTLPSTISKVDVKNADLSTRRKEAPRLIVVTTQGKIGSCFVVADGFELHVSKDIKEAVLSLVMSYYVWDLSYPKHFQLLGLLQSFVLKDSTYFFKSATYIKFAKKLEQYSA
ncbi:uncharacterized protein [Haliotis asinina]|uniref:uncharacterized protein n=1 Tax=Haliotis asinina TaxID=109174 RepID=UPI0035322EEE